MSDPTEWIEAGAGATRIQIRLRAYRTARGLTQAELAGQLKVRRSQVERWEAGRTALSVQALLRLAPLLAAHPLELVRLCPEHTEAADGRGSLPLPFGGPDEG